MTAGLPAGTKVCPGWTSEYSPEQGVDREGNASHYSATKASGEAVRYPCGQPPNGRKTDPSVIRGVSERCSRCSRQKTKFDDDMGAREKRKREGEDRYNGLIDAYVADVRTGDHIWDVNMLSDVVERVDGLKVRAEFPPHARPGEEGYRSWYHERSVTDDEKLDILRSIAGLPRQPRRLR